MAKIWLDWSDGRYYTRLLTDEEAKAAEDKDLDVVHLEDNIWESYHRDCERGAIWQAFWRSIQNEQSMRRREKELQAGCDVEALPLPWQARAREILAEFSVARAAEGIKYQGCCCEHEHLLLDAEQSKKLRDAGFIVENDTEYDIETP